MTSPSRRLARSGTPVAPLSARSRAVLASRASVKRRPPRTPVGQIVLVATILAVIGLAAVGGVVALAAVGVVNAMAQGLPDPSSLQHLTFDQPTVIYDRTGTVELARFELQDRRVVTYDQIPKLVLDTITTAEDRTFWQNDGFDPGAIIAAAVQNATGSEGDVDRGASTITQQLVRARLLPADVTAGDRYVRKVLEIIQSARVTEAYPGEQGKEAIVTAYLNEVYFGHEAYGVGAAAAIYFGVDDLSKLTPAQAALLAGLVKAPSEYDPYHYAVADADGKLVVPQDAPPVVRRNYILSNLAAAARWTQLSAADLQAAMSEPVVLSPAAPPVMKAPQFSWQVRGQLEQMLGGATAVDTGGYKVITSLDWNAQQIAERDVAAAAIVPNLTPKFARYLLASLKVPAADRGWIANLRGKDLHNGLLVAVDYRHGDVLAYVGSAGYYRTDIASSKFQPEFDVAAAGRQPGSSFKPIVYSTAFERNVLDPGSLLLDVSTNFGGGWEPKDADEGERGPVLVRTALQGSLNLPAIRALQRVGSPAVVEVADKLGVNFPGGDDAFLQSGLAGAIGTVETRPIDLTSAFGGLANGGVHVPNRMILSITGPDGASVFQAPAEPQGVRAVSPQTSFLISDVLAGNSDPAQNPIWATALELHNTADGARRPAAAKTGTTDDVRDLSTYGFLAPPTDPSAPGLAVGVWLGNSDHSKPATSNPANSLAAANMWRSFVRDYTSKWPNAAFEPPAGVVRAQIDAWSGGAPGAWTRDTRTEWFKAGTEPGGAHPIDPSGLLYTAACGTWMVDPVKAELGPTAWDRDVGNWLERAKRGAGVTGPYGSHTAYLAGHGSWGGPLLGECRPKPSGNGGNGGGGDHHHHGGGGGGGGGEPVPPASPAASPVPAPSPRRRRRIHAR